MTQNNTSGEPKVQIMAIQRNTEFTSDNGLIDERIIAKVSTKRVNVRPVSYTHLFRLETINPLY